MPWWSFTKTVLSAATLALVARGRVGLDDTVADRPFTVRQVLRHSAGLRDYGGLEAYHEAVAAGDAPWPVAEMLQRVGRGLLFRPGEGWAYSNIGYLLVRRLIERAADAPLQEALDTLVLAPLGIVGPMVADGPAALGATAWGNAAGYDPNWACHGVLLGKAEDATLLLHRLLAGGLLPPALLAAMSETRPAFGPFDVPIEGRPWLSAGYGLGLCDALCVAGRFVGHTDGGPGSSAAVYQRIGADEDGRQRTVAVFAALDALGPVEWESVRLAGLTRREEPI